MSIATVSRVLSSPEKVARTTRERVQAAIDELHYVQHGAARSLAGRSHEAFGLVAPGLRGPYYADLLAGFEAGASEHGASVLVLLTSDKPHADSSVRRLAGRVDAVAIMGTAGVESSTVTTLSGKLPVVLLAALEFPGIETFITESTATARALTEHLLIDHGRRNLRFVGSVEGSPDVLRRYEGFVQAHTAYGITAPAAVPARLKENAGRDVARAVVTGDLSADALVCANDELALALMAKLVEAGIDVPGDIAVTGWDDQMASKYVTPRLTTARQPVRELGQLVATRLAEVLEDPNSPEPNHCLPTSLMLRRSCGCS